MQKLPKNFDLMCYDYLLPENHIAQRPPEQRGASKLLVYQRSTNEIQWSTFNELGKFLADGALLVVNNSRVLPARLIGVRPSGGKAEFLLLTPLPLIEVKNLDGLSCQAEAEGLLKASGRFQPGDVVRFGPGFSLEVMQRMEFGRAKVLLHFEGDLIQNFLRLGHVPLPPYIRREDDDQDKDRYQTVFSSHEKNGSVAAPTAGLHFNEECRQQLLDQGFEWAEITLYVGYGTFSPVRARDIRDHAMHAEYVEISESTALAVQTAKEEGRSVVAVGTTSVRALEGAWSKMGRITAYSGWTDMFIYPGYTFQVVDQLLTNFHLPQSSLLMLVSAMTGRERLLALYAEALRRDFRFFSYGDAMLVL